MSLAKGWWMAWSSPSPRRSGAFVIEIVEKAPVHSLKDQIRGGLDHIKETIGRGRPHVSLAMVGAVGGSLDGSLPLHLRRNTAGGGAGGAGTGGGAGYGDFGEDYLRTGDLFRLRSVKFPEYELGVTSQHVKGDFCYLGLRKVRRRRGRGRKRETGGD